MNYQQSSCSKIIFVGLLYVAVSCNLTAQTTTSKKRQTEKQQPVSVKKDTIRLQNNKTKFDAKLPKDSLYGMETVYKSGVFLQIPRTTKREPLPSFSDSLIVRPIKPSIYNSREQVLSEYKKELYENHKLGDPIYKMDPNAYTIRHQKYNTKMETVYAGGRFYHVPRNASGGGSAPMPAFLVGGTKEVSAKDKKILKNVYDIDVK